MATRVQFEPAFVLHSRAYRESSLLVDLSTRGHGRVAVVARGARGPKSKLRGLLQPFRPLLVSWSARGELGTLTGCEPAAPPLTLPGRSTLSGFYLNELVLRLTRRDDANEPLFDAYTDALSGLADATAPAPVLRMFEKRLLDALGYGLNLTHEADTGRPLDPNGRYAYRPEHGALRLIDPGAGTGFRGRSLLELEAGRLDDAEVLADARTLLRTVIDRYLDGRPLRVRKVAEAMRQ